MVARGLSGTKMMAVVLGVLAVIAQYFLIRSFPKITGGWGESIFYFIVHIFVLAVGFLTLQKNGSRLCDY